MRNEQGFTPPLSRERAYLQQAIPYIEAVTQQMLVSLQTRVFKAVADRELDPQGALNAWIEVYNIHEMVRKLRKQAISEVTQAEQALRYGLDAPNSRT